MNIKDLLGKAQNFIGKVKSKDGEIKNFIQGLKNNKGENIDVSNDESFKRMVSADNQVKTSESEEPKKPNYMIIGVVAVVVLYMLMKKK
jgi:hypothetical protein